MGRNKQSLQDMTPFAKRLQVLIGDQDYAEFERKNGLSRTMVQNLLRGSEPKRSTLEAIISGTGCDAEWLITGKGSRDSLRLKSHTFALPPSGWIVQGRAAADDSCGTRVPDGDEDNDPIIPPDGLTCVEVTGDSMSPVVLDGQYVMIDKGREGFATDGGIVVASIREPDADDDRYEPLTGTFVKRCYNGGNGIYYFASINEYSPFSAWQDHCRIWPVIGIWFAGRGKPPVDLH